MFGASLPLAIIQYPSKRFGFVGSVPSDLAFESSKAEYLTIAKQSGPGIAKKIAEREGGVFKSLSWATDKEARDHAEKLGHKVA